MDRTSESSCGAAFDGSDVSPTLHKPNGAPGYSDQEIFGQQGAYLARVMDMSHADEALREVRGGAAPTLQQRMETGGNQVPVLAVRTAQTSANGCGIADETAHTLDRAQGQGVAVGCSHVASGAMLDSVPGPVGVPLKRSPGGGGAVAVGIDGYNQSQTGEVSKPLNSAATDTDHIPSVAMRHIVRRLTPTECERLQGFPDGWTMIPWRGKPAEECPDSPRYRALGNSWACNCAEWVLRRVAAAARLGMA